MEGEVENEDLGNGNGEEKPVVRRGSKGQYRTAHKSRMPVPKKRKGNYPSGQEHPGSKHDWGKIREAYVEGIEDADGNITLPTFKELSAKFGVSYSYIGTRASKERWTSLRTEFQNKIAQERQRKRALTIASDAVRFDESAHNASKLGMTMVVKRLAEIANESKDNEARLRQARERHARGEPVAKWELQSPIYFRELEGLASALERFQSIGMRALGTDVQRHEVMSTVEQNTTINIAGELHRDDPDRLALFLKGMQEAGIADFLLADGSLQQITDAEIVDDDDDADGEAADDNNDDNNTEEGEDA